MSDCEHGCGGCHKSCDSGQEAVLEPSETDVYCPDCNVRLKNVKLTLSGKIVGLACELCGFVFDPSTMGQIGKLF